MADKTLNRTADELDNTKWGHRWGYADTRFIIKPDRSVYVTGNRYAVSGYDMPGLLIFAEEVLGVRIDVGDLKPEREDKPVPETDLERTVHGGIAVSVSDIAVLVRSA